MEKVRRILVHLSKENAAPQCARFLQSITGHFVGSAEDQATVSCSLENNRFILGDRLCDGGVPLKRASFCPIKYLSDSEAVSLPSETLSRGVDVGVAVLLQSANQKLLLTRRASSLRSFPNVWVPPGGHVELDEKLLDAGLRELLEETGLNLSPDEICSRLLGLWESVYPPMLTIGLPKRHHIVTYILLKSSQTHLQIQASLRPDPAEVSACVWVDADLVKAVVSAVDGEKECVQIPADLPESISVTKVSPDGKMSESSLPVSVLCNRAPDYGDDIERVSTGTKFALELWLKTLEHHADMG
ncbi:nucleoside diphosphate-linked moiety X motif 17 isoform X1 [Danio rerio]|uniref:m7GpppN-mRNA hydrolase NUDT17 n=1 Tax=Danio rerio TaxID=7955 RepID=F1QMV9_DANRE|nr:nucleoside diphosphate-linked moiety X motif 17 isoform X1 [Danio rerio]|eukprot:XP_005158331.1 nucleoside diphosphate-linked moiety X motif 17 isoform X1 [Danio rerio]